MADEHLIFLSYSSPDLSRVLPFYEHLKARGLDVWLDKRRLKAGQNWNFEIGRALQKATIIVVFLSENSVDRRGYAQREIKIALNQAQERLIDDIYIVPVMLDRGVPRPAELGQIQFVEPDDGDPQKAVAEAIDAQLVRLGVETARVQGESNLRWSYLNYKDSWEGLPGYETSYQLIQLSSDEYPRASEITEVIHGWLVGATMEQRRAKLEQAASHYNFGTNAFLRTNTWEASCGEPKIKERIVSIPYTVWWYGAGAAHPNMFFRTFSFILAPVIPVADLQELFPERNRGAALEVVQTEARAQLLAPKSDISGEDRALEMDADWVEKGTSDWEAFGAFLFAESGIEILFSPYAVAPYAYGSHVITVPYSKLAKLMDEFHANALGINHLRRDFQDFR
jgi:hypothetical protein